MIPKESQGHNEERDSYYSQYNNPYISSEEQARRDARQTLLCHCLNYRDVSDEEQSETKVDEDAFVESLIDQKGYAVEFAIIVKRNDILRIASHRRLNTNLLEADEVAHAICTLPPMNVNEGAPICTPKK